MICIRSTSDDPCFNLAAEEYLLKKTSLDFFLLYRNRPSVIVGKHQNTLAEINLDFIRGQNIKVVRRISGGGTVYHDEGNVNYSFIRNGEKGKLVDFKRHTRPIINFLSTLGLQVQDDGRNSLTIDGKKISGNAEHVYQDRVLHHGTLLFSSALNNLEEALKTQQSGYQDKAIRSIPSTVTNLADCLAETITIESFTSRLFSFVMGSFEDSSEYEFTTGDLEEIDRLIKEKYDCREWNYGYSPRYSHEKELLLLGKPVTLMIDVDNGLIASLNIVGESVADGLQEKLRQALTGKPHSPDIIYESLKGFIPDVGETDLQNIIAGFF